jgi:hypothetical protein
MSLNSGFINTARFATGASLVSLFTQLGIQVVVIPKINFFKIIE